MHESRNADTRGDLGDAFGSLFMNVVKGEVSFAHGPQDQHRINDREEKRHAWSHSRGRRGCTRYRSAGHTQRSVPRYGCPIPFQSSGHPVKMLIKINGGATGRTHKGDDLSEVARDLQVALLVFITVWYNDLRACLRCVPPGGQISCSSLKKKTHRAWRRDSGRG